MYKLKLIEIIDFKIDGKVVMEINLVMEYLYFLQEENTFVFFSDVSRCYYICCYGDDCFFVNYFNQFFSESNSFNGSGYIKFNRKFFKFCFRK